VFINGIGPDPMPLINRPTHRWLAGPTPASPMSLFILGILFTLKNNEIHHSANMIFIAWPAQMVLADVARAIGWSWNGRKSE
jgi:hypothetical protein